MSVFEKLNAIDVSGKIDKKGNLSYLSWAWAYGELMKAYPLSTYKVYENKDEWNYFTDGRTAWVKVGVTVEEIEHIEMLPVMDFKNKSISMQNLTSMDVNKAIQRALTKAIARHGLGLYIYAGEDLPELPPVQNINKEQVTELVKLIAAAKTTMLGMFNGLGWRISRLEDIQQTNFEYVKSLLVAKIAKNEAENAKEEEK